MIDTPVSGGRGPGIVLAVGVLVVLAAWWVRDGMAFDLSRVTVDERYIASGGPPKDGIPAIDTPRFVPARAASFLADDDRVLGLAISGDAKAYPIRILDKHEIVNDAVGEIPIAITWCPLTGSGRVFDRRIKGSVTTFGVSGLLYNSNVLLYDRATDSLWSQLEGAAISGPRQGTQLLAYPVDNTSWGEWKTRHPATHVLSNVTAIYPPASYAQESYPGYASSRRVWFPVAAHARTYHPKERVLGIVVNGKAKAYRFAELSGGKLADTVGGERVTIQFNRRHSHAMALDDAGEPVSSATVAYWFAWKAFHPGTGVYASTDPSFPDTRPASRPAPQPADTHPRTPRDFY